MPNLLPLYFNTTHSSARDPFSLTQLWTDGMRVHWQVCYILLRCLTNKVIARRGRRVDDDWVAGHPKPGVEYEIPLDADQATSHPSI